MTAIEGHGPAMLPSRLWRNPAGWLMTVDLCAILIALSLPWSTSLVAIFGAALLITRIPFLDVRSFLQLLRQPICLAPIALFLLACVGTLWSDASWTTRLHAINPTIKLLMLPVLFYHFQRSERGLWVFIAFLISCSLLAAMSWIVLFHPELSFRQIDPEPGIFVKSHIQQGQEFTLCAVALAFPIIASLRAKKFEMAALLVAVGKRKSWLQFSPKCEKSDSKRPTSGNWSFPNSHGISQSQENSRMSKKYCWKLQTFAGKMLPMQ